MQLQDNVIVAELVTVVHKGKQLFIPHIAISPLEDIFPFKRYFGSFQSILALP